MIVNIWNAILNLFGIRMKKISLSDFVSSFEKIIDEDDYQNNFSPEQRAYLRKAYADGFLMVWFLGIHRDVDWKKEWDVHDKIQKELE
jgi:hypothetical protein